MKQETVKKFSGAGIEPRSESVDAGRGDAVIANGKAVSMQKGEQKEGHERDEKPEFFGKQHAAHYDKSNEGLAPIKEALHLVMKTALLDLPEASTILCVGVGTGAELLALAKAHPGWRFMALDTSEAMLDICRVKVKEAGILSRCEFHAGPIDTLPSGQAYDAATAILVSQFLTEETARIGFFTQIKNHLKSGGYLINADLSRPQTDLCHNQLMSNWFNMHKFNGMSDDQAKAATAMWDEHLAVVEPRAVESVIKASGLSNPLLVFQFLFIHAWVSRKV